MESKLKTNTSLATKFNSENRKPPQDGTDKPKKPTWVSNCGIMCHACETIFYEKATFEEHYQTEHNFTEISYCCTCCRKQNNNYTNFRNHCYRHLIGGRFKCEFCSKTFAQRRALTIHLEVFHYEEADNEGKPFQCNQCVKKFATEAGLKFHIKNQHPLEKKYVCDECKKIFRSPGALVLHRADHKAAGPFTCHLCDSKFANNADKQKHVKEHKEKKNYSCQFCDRIFTDKFLLSRHLPYHNEVREYKCDICDKLYKTKRCLKVHSLVHSPNRPFKCETCGKGFLSSTKLRQHNNTHTGERPFECKYCERTFTNYPNWLKHIRRLHKVDHRTGLALRHTSSAHNSDSFDSHERIISSDDSNNTKENSDIADIRKVNVKKRGKLSKSGELKQNDNGVKSKQNNRNREILVSHEFAKVQIVVVQAEDPVKVQDQHPQKDPLFLDVDEYEELEAEIGKQIQSSIKNEYVTYMNKIVDDIANTEDPMTVPLVKEDSANGELERQNKTDIEDSDIRNKFDLKVTLFHKSDNELDDVALDLPTMVQDDFKLHLETHELDSPRRNVDTLEAPPTNLPIQYGPEFVDFGQAGTTLESFSPQHSSVNLDSLLNLREEGILPFIDPHLAFSKKTPPPPVPVQETLFKSENVHFHPDLELNDLQTSEDLADLSDAISESFLDHEEVIQKILDITAGAVLPSLDIEEYILPDDYSNLSNVEQGNTVQTDYDYFTGEQSWSNVYLNPFCAGGHHYRSGGFLVLPPPQSEVFFE